MTGEEIFHLSDLFHNSVLFFSDTKVVRINHFRAHLMSNHRVYFETFLMKCIQLTKIFGFLIKEVEF